MRFQVPQFLEVEDKIFGPLTFKQFIYLGGGAGLCVIFYMVLPKFLAFLLMFPIASLAAALAFYKHNNKPFIFLIEAFFKYFVGGKLYVWKKEPKKPAAVSERAPAAGTAASNVYIPKLGESRLKDLTWSLDVKENVNPVTPAAGKNQDFRI